jgi:hypothetical protein
VPLQWRRWQCCDGEVGSGINLAITTKSPTETGGAFFVWERLGC